MDDFLSAIGVQAMKYAIRSGIALTTSYTLGRLGHLLQSVEDKKEYVKLQELRTVLECKIRVLSPAIDLVELKAGRGNVFLESAVPLTKALHRDIVSLGQRIEALMSAQEDTTSHPTTGRISKQQFDVVTSNIKLLLDRIDRETPLLQLAITASGESLATSLPSTVSPSRLLQASTFLSIGDTQHAQNPFTLVQRGTDLNGVSDSSEDIQESEKRMPGCSNEHGIRKPLWQEVIHKARVRLCREPAMPTGLETDQAVGLRPDSRPNKIPEYAYYLEVIEDYDDGRVHDLNVETDGEGSCLGARRTIPVQQISKIFYTDTGKLLNLHNNAEDENKPVLLLKRDVKRGRDVDATNAVNQIAGHHQAPTVREEHFHSDSHSDDQAEVDRQLEGEFGSSEIDTAAVGIKSDDDTFPSHLDPAWLAFEMFGEQPEHDTETDEEQSAGMQARDSQGSAARPSEGRTSLGSSFISQFRNISFGTNEALDLRRPSSATSAHQSAAEASIQTTQDDGFVARSPFHAITSSLSLFEMLVRLAGLQEFQQTSHLSVPDHIMTFFLEETSTTGLSGEERRQEQRRTRQRVGFNPYTDSTDD